MFRILILLLTSVILSHAQHTSKIPIKTFCDSMAAKGIAEQLVPGVAITIIKEGETFKSSYGFSNTETQQPIDPETTLFQLGSVGKLFTAIAVMQLVEKKKLDLNTDVNEYLTDFKLSNTYSTPLTLSQLLTHTPGFNDQIIGYAARSEKDLDKLSVHLKLHTPTFQREPGKEIDYSNYGYALAGYLVEIASGQTFKQYVKEHIFDKLEMRHTTYSLPDDYEAHPEYARGYAVRDNGYKFIKSFPRHPTPAGSVLSTANDMTLFLKELMNPTEKLLLEDSYAKLITHQFSQHPLLLGYTLGFEEQNINGRKGFAKGGAVPGFLSSIALFPENKMGFFLVTNTQTDNFLESFVATFFDQYFPQDNHQKVAPVSINLKPFVGTYASNRTNTGTIEEMGFLFRGNFDIWVTEDNYLGCYHNLAFQKYEAIDSLVFQNVNNPHEYLVFEKNSQGRIHQLYRNVNHAGFYVPESLTKVKWYDDPTFINEYYFFVFLVICLFVFILPFRGWVWLKRRNNASYMRGKLLPNQAVIAALAVVIFYSSHFILGFMYFFKHAEDFFFGVPETFKLVQYTTYLFPLVIAVLIYFCMQLWAKRQSNLVARIFYSLVTVSSLIHLIFLHRWHFIGLNV